MEAGLVQVQEKDAEINRQQGQLQTLTVSSQLEKRST